MKGCIVINMLSRDKTPKKSPPIEFRSDHIRSDQFLVLGWRLQGCTKGIISTNKIY